MTIKHKLIISHVVVFIVPVMMTALVIIICGLGLLSFVRNGNHIYVESAQDFQHACEAVHKIIFNKNSSVGYWLIELLAPEQNYIRVKEEGKVIYSYGNESLQSIGKNYSLYLVSERSIHDEDKALESTLIWIYNQINFFKKFNLEPNFIVLVAVDFFRISRVLVH